MKPWTIKIVITYGHQQGISPDCAVALISKLGPHLPLFFSTKGNVLSLDFSHLFFFLYERWAVIRSTGERTLQWHHNGRDDVSNHQAHDCLLNRLFRRRAKKTSKFRVTCLFAGNTPITAEFRTQMASNTENVPIGWRHHDDEKNCLGSYLFSTLIIHSIFLNCSLRFFINYGKASNAMVSNAWTNIKRYKLQHMQIYSCFMFFIPRVVTI